MPEITSTDTHTHHLNYFIRINTMFIFNIEGFWGFGVLGFWGFGGFTLKFCIL